MSFGRIGLGFSYLKKSDGQKRLSGSEYKTCAKIKTVKQEQVKNKQKSLINFFKHNIEEN